MRLHEVDFCRTQIVVRTHGIAIATRLTCHLTSIVLKEWFTQCRAVRAIKIIGKAKAVEEGTKV